MKFAVLFTGAICGAGIALVLILTGEPLATVPFVVIAIGAIAIAKIMEKDMTYPDDKVFGNPCAQIDIPKLSKWKCELFGTGSYGLTLRPREGEEPNWFWRWMQYLIIGNKWIKDE